MRQLLKYWFNTELILTQQPVVYGLQYWWQLLAVQFLQIFFTTNSLKFTPKTIANRERSLSVLHVTLIWHWIWVLCWNSKNNFLTLIHFIDSEELVKLLIEKGADVNSQNYAGWTPLMWTVCVCKGFFSEFVYT